MLQWAWQRLLIRYEWLNPKHPVAVRDHRWMHAALPGFLRRLQSPWSLFGFAAMLHAMFFAVALFAYNGFGQTFIALVIPALAPFLTPFGTPLLAGVLHSILYWAMLIGVCNQMTLAVSRELESGTWRLLRLTPFSSADILLTKAAVVVRNWAASLRTLTILRLIALLIVPIGVASQRSREVSMVTGYDLIGVFVFLGQPFAEILLALGLSMMVAVLVRNPLWSKVYAYGAVALFAGGFNAIGSFWLTFTSPIGAISGLFVPLGHWSPLIAATIRPNSAAVFTSQMLVLSLSNFLLPLVVGLAAITITTRMVRERD